MTVADYAEQALTTDKHSDGGSLTFPMLGLFGETGSLLSEVKKKQRDQKSYKGYAGAVVEELGDVLIQVIFHAQLAEEKGLFDLEAVAREVNEKLVRRHPHVFGENKLGTSDEVLKQWEAIKLEEKKKQGKTESGLFKGLPPQLPALMYAEASWKQIEKKNLALSSGELAAAVREKEASLSDEGLGRQLFVLAAAARKNGLDPEGALRRFTSSVIADAQTCAQRPSGNS